MSPKAGATILSLSPVLRQPAQTARSAQYLIPQPTHFNLYATCMKDFAQGHSKSARRERFAEVIAGIRDYTAEELDGELLDLYEASKKLLGFD